MVDPLRVVVDTNIWVSAFINRRGACFRIMAAFFDGQLMPVMSLLLLAEFMTVTDRPRIRRQSAVTDEERDRFIDLLHGEAVWVRPTGTLRLCRDVKDDMVLETAILGRAQYLVTRDDDIKRDEALIAALAPRGVQVVTVARMLDILGEPGSRPGG